MSYTCGIKFEYSISVLILCYLPDVISAAPFFDLVEKFDVPLWITHLLPFRGTGGSRPPQMPKQTHTMSHTQITIGAAEVADAFVKMSQELQSLVTNAEHYIESYQERYDKAILEDNEWDKKYYSDNLSAYIVKREMALKLQLSFATYCAADFLPKGSVSRSHKWETTPVDPKIYPA